ncbi:ParB/RepB/Spo0J family partition protein [Sulfurospirillum sp. T05]|uniref:ParB/RepB/Spo0J family partition protein n=1 Tax=Sulfurospirillum tamanense TaxID=2813362 RepID=A0ABS2WQN1_9BACT|nr:ParB/RepB/Spo0J family partition protein [Sulfurospirillum tamanensis]MBN2963698.1 ParB/RepB/Spo0J family partition protein [Sulfurospirillum tamanensis]
MAKKALGRGLGAIIGDVEDAYNQELNGHSADLVREIEINAIRPNPFQPRTHFDETALEELSRSIKKHGLLQPILVVEKEDGYMLLAGERRLRASKLAGVEYIKAIVADIASENLRELALIENIQRENLNPVELANAYYELIEEYAITQEGLSEIIHKSRTQITNTLRLLSLSEQTKRYISEGKISQGHAKIIVGLSPEEEEKVVQTILGQKLSVRDTETLIKRLKEGKTASKKTSKPEISPLLSSAKERLQGFGLKVKVSNNSIAIAFKNEREIEDFLNKMSQII